MLKWERPKRIRGCEVHLVSPDTLSWFAPGGVAWTWEFFGWGLKRHAVLVAEAVKGIRDAVLYSLAYEQAREDMRAEARRAELHIARHPDDNARVLKMSQGGIKE